MPLPESANRARAAAYARPRAAWELHRDEQPERPRPRQMRPAEVRQNDRNEGVRRQATDEIARSRAFRQGALSDTMMNEAGRNEVNTPPGAYFGQDVLEMTGAPALSRSMDAASVGDWPRAAEQGAWGTLGVLGMATLPLAGGRGVRPPPRAPAQQFPDTPQTGALRSAQPEAVSATPRVPDAGNGGAGSGGLGPTARYQFVGPRGQAYEVVISPDERAGVAAIGFWRARTDGYAPRYRPHNDLTPGEARAVYREVSRIVREDAEKHGRSAYGATGYTQRQTGLYETLAEADGPSGYVRDTSAPNGLVWRRSQSSPDGGSAGAQNASALPNAGPPQQRPGALRR